MTKIFSRRRFISTAGAAAASTLLVQCCVSDPNAVFNPVWSANINPSDAPETTIARLGFIALTDAAPLLIAKAKGYFAKYGMKDIKIFRQSSWGMVRDNLLQGGDRGGIDGAHILSPMPYLMSTGTITEGKPIPMYILARLNLNGQGISVANIYREINVRLDSSLLKKDVEKGITASQLLKVAVTFPGGNHDLWMRYWLAAGGINPDTDTSIFTVPPPQMVANMKTGTMNTFCVGEPWNAQLVNQQIGYSALTTGEIWNEHPEKAFTMRSDWVDKHPKATKALLMAIMEAQMWCDRLENKTEMCQIVSHCALLDVPTQDIEERAKGNFNYGDGRIEKNSPHRMKFWENYASYPFKSHDLWFLTENIRWGYLPPDTNIEKLVNAVNREDLWKEAAKAIGQSSAIPKSVSRGVERFFNGTEFDPENPSTYLQSLTIKKSRPAKNTE